jgi:hypothetical protein
MAARTARVLGGHNVEKNWQKSNFARIQCDLSVFNMDRNCWYLGGRWTVIGD